MAKKKKYEGVGFEGALVEAGVHTAFDAMAAPSELPVLCGLTQQKTLSKRELPGLVKRIRASLLYGSVISVGWRTSGW